MNRRSILECDGPSPLRLGVSAVLLLWLVSTGFTQSYSIDWHTIDGGGGTSTGGVYSVSGIPQGGTNRTRARRAAEIIRSSAASGAR